MRVERKALVLMMFPMTLESKVLFAKLCCDCSAKGGIIARESSAKHTSVFYSPSTKDFLIGSLWLLGGIPGYFWMLSIFWWMNLKYSPKIL